MTAKYTFQLQDELTAESAVEKIEQGLKQFVSNGGLQETLEIVNPDSPVTILGAQLLEDTPTQTPTALPANVPTLEPQQQTDETFSPTDSPRSEQPSQNPTNAPTAEMSLSKARDSLTNNQQASTSTRTKYSLLCGLVFFFW